MPALRTVHVVFRTVTGILLLGLVYRLAVVIRGVEQIALPDLITQGSVRQLQPGDQLPNLRLVGHSARTGRVTGTRYLSELPGPTCTIVIFFQSTCAGCRAVAHEWRGRSFFESGAESIPVVWMGVAPTDSGANDFINGNELRDDYYLPQSAQEIVDLGVVRWPSVYVVGPGPILVRKPGLLPSDLDSRPGGCSSWLKPSV